MSKWLDIETPIQVDIGTFCDDVSIGEAQVHHNAIRVSFRNLRLTSTRHNREATVAGCLVISSDGSRLLAAFTEPNAQWDAPCPLLQPRDLSTSASGFAKKVAPAITPPQHRVPEVFEALWSRFGADPLEHGQVVVRPRIFTTIWPPNRVNGRRVAGEPKDRIYWVCQMLGKVYQRYEEVPGAYHTQRIIFLNDEDLQSGTAFYAR